MFHIGQHVVCIDDFFKQEVLNYLRRQGINNFITKGIVYTIRDIHKSTKETDNSIYFLLEEVVNPPVYFPTIDRYKEPAFDSVRFKPLKKLNVEDFMKKKVNA